MADFSKLDASTAGLVQDVTSAVGTMNSAVEFINGLAARITAAVTVALEADNAADQTSINAAVAAIEAERAKAVAAASQLAAAITANP